MCHLTLPPRHLPSHCRSPRRHDSQAKQAQAPVGNALRPQGRRPRLAIYPRQETRWQVSVELTARATVLAWLRHPEFLLGACSMRPRARAMPSLVGAQVSEQAFHIAAVSQAYSPSCPQSRFSKKSSSCSSLRQGTRRRARSGAGRAPRNRAARTSRGH